MRTKAVKYACKLHSDIAAPNDNNTLREGLHCKYIVGVHGKLRSGDVRFEWPSSGGNQNSLCIKQSVADTHLGWGYDFPFACHNFDPRSFKYVLINTV